MLDLLLIEREHGRSRNLIVAATGTGKTVIAAFDYRMACEQEGGRPRLLFVAHREEMLKQALRTYREVLRDHSFGELLVGGVEIEHFDHVFASIDSIVSRDLVNRCGADYWHTVVVDECHRLAADRFHSFVIAVRPRILLGLTATPERSDGQPIMGYFESVRYQSALRDRDNALGREATSSRAARTWRGCCLGYMRSLQRRGGFASG